MNNLTNLPPALAPQMQQLHLDGKMPYLGGGHVKGKYNELIWSQS